MNAGIAPAIRKVLHKSLRQVFGVLPRKQRFAIYRSFVDCDPAPSDRLQLKIAETQEELEACFRLLHDAYVQSGFMKPHPSGMRVTLYHALPTTTTLCAKWDDEVVGTISLIRDSAFGFPLQAIFDLSGVRALEGNIAEVSALAVHPRFRKTGGAILFPLMKFMYEYCTTFFDTRHLVIAVNPSRIEMYESLLFFQRLTANVVDKYDFANGAPAVGGWLDLRFAPEIFRDAYAAKLPRKNLFAYFTQIRLPNIQLPQRRYYTTNDPVLTPDLLNYFFNKRTDSFAKLDKHRKELLHLIYDLPDYEAVLPKLPLHQPLGLGPAGRQHRRYFFKCPGHLTIAAGTHATRYALEVVEISQYGFQAKADKPLPLDVLGDVTIEFGRNEISTVKARALNRSTDGISNYFGFSLGEPDLVWNKFLAVLAAGRTHGDLENATRFLT